MKIELIKENLPLSKPQYIIEVDGAYLSGSATSDYEQACGFYEEALKNSQKTIEVIKSTEI